MLEKTLVRIPNMCLTPIYDGLTKKQIVAFEIPVDDVKSKLSVLVPEKGFSQAVPRFIPFRVFR
jgi:hypothetical protein